MVPDACFRMPGSKSLHQRLRALGKKINNRCIVSVMNYRTTCYLLIAVCMVAGVVWLVERKADTPGVRQDRSRRVLPIKVEDVTSLIIEKGAFRVVCVKRGGSWYLQYPLEARADDGKIERVLSTLEALPRKEVITAQQRKERRLGFEDYGLDEPRARFIVRDDLSRIELRVGRDAPLGEYVYVRRAFSTDVIATPRGLLASVPARVADMRDSRVLHGEASRTSRLEIQRPTVGFIRVTQTKERWLIEKPAAAVADSARIAGMLDALYALRVESFVWDPQVAATNAEAPAPAVAIGAVVPVDAYGLAPDEAAARVQTWLHGNEVGRELILGKSVEGARDQVYAKLRDSDSVYAVGADILRKFTVSVNDLRDRRLFQLEPAEVKYACLQDGDAKIVLKKQDDDNWLLTQPAQWKADSAVVDQLISKLTRLTVERFLDAGETNAAAPALTEPAYTVELRTREPAPDAAETAPPPDTAAAEAVVVPGGEVSPSRLIVGAFQAESTTVYARFENDSLTFTLSPDAVRDLDVHPSAPLVYKDRMILSIPADSIRKVALMRNGVEQSVIRNDSGGWTAVTPADHEIDKRALSDLILFASRVRAKRIEAHNPKDVAVYGLDRPRLMLTLGLTGEKGIQKSVLIGNLALPDGLHAMVQGQDVVFVLDKNLVDLLSRDLLRAPPGEDSPEATDDGST
jgi:hypothetical protein